MKQDRTPKRGDRVHAKGHTGEFLVLRVRKKEGVADLGLTGADSVNENVPFSAISTIGEDANQAAARVLREAKERT